MNKTSKKPATTTDNNTTARTRISFPLKRSNFIIMVVAALMIVLGFCLIAGGAPQVDGEFNPEVFSARRIVVGPTIAFLGFIVMGVGIMWTPKSQHTKDLTADGND